jgi:hypothetical protein
MIPQDYKEYPANIWIIVIPEREIYKYNKQRLFKVRYVL